MAEVLSQAQIDALLGSLQGNGTTIEEIEKEEPEKKVRKYDFNSPKKFTKDKLKIVGSIFDNYARMTTSQINSLFRTTCEVNVLAVEEQRYYEFTNAMKDNDVLTLVNVSMPDHMKNPPLIMHATIPLMLNLIDRMLGGIGYDSGVPDSYTYTEIEISLYQRVIRYIIAVLKDAWASYIRMQFEFERIETNPGMFQEIGMDETVVIIVMEVVQNDHVEKITICMPGNLLMNAFEVIERRKNSAQGEEEEGTNTREEILNNIRISELDVSAHLGDTMITLEDVYNLHEGDVIDLGQAKDSLIDLFIEGQPWFKAQLGFHRKNVAVKIENRIGEEEEPGEEEEAAVI